MTSAPCAADTASEPVPTWLGVNVHFVKTGGTRIGLALEKIGPDDSHYIVCEHPSSRCR